MVEIDWHSVQLVVFDVDGTLYDQGRLRRRMMTELALHCLLHPRDLRVLRIIASFRRCREALAEEECDRVVERQYSRPARELGIEPGAVREVIEEWMEQRPLPFLRGCRCSGVGRLFEALRARGKSLAVWSDYPTRRKLSALELEVDWQVSAVEPEIDRLKPHPRGLERLLELAGIGAHQALMIGDRQDRDGAGARRAAVKYLHKTGKRPGDAGALADFDPLVGSL